MEIRNFCIIAHIDHGKSTLADRFLDLTGAVDSREKRDQLLDTMDLERERGITIKLQPVRMHWTPKTKTNPQKFQLNLIDTPGHVDFSYEVSRSLAACEGAILVVDATQGIEAQTLANVYLALEQGLEIIPVLNKIDLPAADPAARAAEMEKALGFSANEILCISAKTGAGVPELLDQICAQIPPPQKNQIFQKTPEIFDDCGTRALIFDSTFDSYRGVVASVRVFSGEIQKGQKLQLLKTARPIDALEVGFLSPKYCPTQSLKSGEVGYLVTGLKNVVDARVGDTIWAKGASASGGGVNAPPKKASPAPLPGYCEVQHFVFAGIFPVSGDDFPLLRTALEKLSLNDASLFFEPENSGALGHGFRAGFLGMLHLEIVQERLEREFDLNILVTAPSVGYEILTAAGATEKINNPSQLPEPNFISEIREPWAKLTILVPSEKIGAIMKLCTDRRGVHKNIQYLGESRAEIFFEMPLAEMVTDFYDDLKSVSSGYASLSYEFLEMRAGDLAKMDILVAGDTVDALSQIIFRPRAHQIGKVWAEKLKEIIPRAQFPIPVQAALGANIVARETISALRKDVTAKLYGGDVTRKNKLLQKQKKGKKRLKQFGKVSIPQDAFFAMLKK